MPPIVNHIVIVGGGSAGWLCAAYLAKRLGTQTPDGIKISLIESSDIPPIGVGEGTFPSIRSTLAAIGVNERRFLSECSSTLKQGIRFVNWNKPVAEQTHSYYHPFNFPRLLSGHLDISAYWLSGYGDSKRSFAHSVAPQAAVCDNRLAPKRVDDQPFKGPMNYAYHIDAGKFVTFMRKEAIALGVKHIIGTVENVSVDEKGYITEIASKDTRSIKADLFIDCTGFHGQLISKFMGAAQEDVSDILFADRAIAVRIPYDHDAAPIESTTLSVAQKAGWIWDIGLKDRRGVGYVYSSNHSSDDAAEQELQNYIGDRKSDVEPLKIKMRTGYCKTPWIKNCVGLGLSGGFLEPLEATGIAMCEAAIRLIADYFPRNGDMAPVAKHFNKAMKERYENAIEFIKLHYCLTNRTDSQFWIDNTESSSIPSGLLDKLELWKHRVPMPSDFSSLHDMFRHESYQYILFGMDFRPDMSVQRYAYPHPEKAQAEFQRINQASINAVGALPDHREFLDDYAAADTPG